MIEKTTTKWRHLVFAFFILFGFTVNAQITIAKQSFETSGDTWTPLNLSVPACTSGNAVWDYVTTLNGQTPSDGAQFWGIRDLRGDCNGNANGFERMALPNVDVSSYSNVVLSFDYYADGFDNQDDIRYILFYDDVNQGNVTVVDGGTTNSTTGGWLTETINIPPTVTNVRIRIRVRQDGADDYGGIDNIRLEGYDPSEIDLYGNGNPIPDGSTSGSTANDTDFGSTTAGTPVVRTFTIENNGSGNLDLTGSPLVDISGSTDFTVTSAPTTPIAPGASTTFEITYNPAVASSATAIVTINNNDNDESIYDFVIQGTATPVGGGPEIEVQGNDLAIFDGDTTPSTDDFTDFGITDLTTPIAIPFFIYNFGTSSLTISSSSLSGSGDFSLTTPTNTFLATGSVTDFVVTFTPSSVGVFTTTVTIESDDSDEGTYTFTIQAEVQNLGSPTYGPGGINSNLKLWLRADSEAGTIADLGTVSVWNDQAFGSTRTAKSKIGEQPTYRNNETDNVNFNPAVYFDGTQSMFAGQGFNSNDLYIVLRPDGVIDQNSSAKDIFCGDDISINPGSQDVTGFEMGASSARYSNEVVAFNQASEASYGAAEIGSIYSGVQMFNVRENSGGTGVELYNNGNLLTTTEVNTSTYKDIVNSRYWLGRSEFFGASYDGSILEVITYDQANGVASRDQIESYLAIKYGVTLGINGTSQDYVDGTGSVIWDASVNTGFNYDIAGIGRDDSAQLNQKQSKSENPTSEVAIGLGSVAATNSANSNTFTNDRDYLVWGHNGQNLDYTSKTVDVTLGPETVISPVDASDRVWKIVETATTDIPATTVRISTAAIASALPALSGNDAYVFLVADDAALTVNQETLFLETNGSNQEVTYDFDGTKYFTFGIAHEVIASRRMEFDGNDDHIQVGDRLDLTSAFTISAWVRTTGSNNDLSNKSIVSKDGSTNGYELVLTDANRVRFRNGNGENIRSSGRLDTNVWHHVAIIHDGTTASIYIDGVLDIAANIALPTDNSNTFTIGANYRSDTDIQKEFAGDLDEIRIWDAALTADELRFIMNQEIEQSGTNVFGKILPTTLTKYDISGLDWNDLSAYYSMNNFIGTHLNDASGNGNRGSLRNAANYDVEAQTAPLPYISLADGDWTAEGTWENATVGALAGQYAPGTTSVSDSNVTIDWNIVSVSHNVSATTDAKVLALFSNSNELTVSGDSELSVSHYLKLDGSIDLEGESQLVQEDGSDLATDSAGFIERDQQGIADSYTYNYWSLPVGTINTTSNNAAISIANAMRDGTNPTSPQNITFSTSATGADAGATSPITLSSFWMYRFIDSPADDYNGWNFAGNTGNITAGEGFTMKGPGTGGVLDEQNFVFTGKPNNGTMTLPLSNDNEYLVGNPYPSAIDADEFIMDNPTTDGSLRFWQHFASTSHIVFEYQGGYAIYNLSGGTPAVSHPDIDQTGSGTKTPGRYVPVAQGFFVTDDTTNPTAGNITFENDQRIFVTEAVPASSIFIRGTERAASEAPEDTRTKLRIGFDSPGQLHRQLLLTIDERTTDGIDWAFDAKKNEEQYDDMTWLIDDEKYVIQAIPAITEDKELKLAVDLTYGGTMKIGVDAFENLPEGIDVFLRDELDGTETDLKLGAFETDLTPGSYKNRFVLVFKNQVLGVEDAVLSDTIDIIHLGNANVIRIVNNSNEVIDGAVLYNLMGQKIQTWNQVPSNEDLPLNRVASGTYVFQLKIGKNSITKKLLIK